MTGFGTSARCCIYCIAFSFLSTCSRSYVLHFISTCSSSLINAAECHDDPPLTALPSCAQCIANFSQERLLGNFSTRRNTSLGGGTSVAHDLLLLRCAVHQDEQTSSGKIALPRVFWFRVGVQEGTWNKALWGTSCEDLVASCQIKPN
jgi:hypothetical protein